MYTKKKNGKKHQTFTWHIKQTLTVIMVDDDDDGDDDDDDNHPKLLAPFLSLMLEAIFLLLI